MMKLSTQKLRREYGKTPLLEENLRSDPLQQFSLWLKDAIKAKIIEPNAMTLSTLSEGTRPSCRTVLLKHLDTGFVFFTQYRSRKGKQLAHHPFAALNFLWKEISRQVTIEGKVKKTSRKESEAYFKKRPRGAQLAALASTQSAPLASREELQQTFLLLKKKYQGKKIPCPKNWGGFRLIPERIEFWQGHADRLHDRFLYVCTDNDWIFTRLSP